MQFLQVKFTNMTDWKNNGQNGRIMVNGLENVREEPIVGHKLQRVRL